MKAHELEQILSYYPPDAEIKITGEIEIICDGEVIEVVQGDMFNDDDSIPA